MKTKILSMTLLALAVTAPVGCRSHPQSDPATAAPASSQPMTDATASTNGVAQPAVTNPADTNVPAATNQ